jgi:transposase
LADYASGGQKALQAKPIPGRPQKISLDKMRGLAKTLKDGTPPPFKFEYALWTRAWVGEVLARQLGQRLSKGSVGRLMRILGFTVPRSLYRA